MESNFLKWNQVLKTVRWDDNKCKSQLNLCDHDTCSLSVIAANHCPLLSFCTSSAMWSQWIFFYPLLLLGGHFPAPQHSVMVMPSLALNPPHCSPGSTDIVLLPVSSNSSGPLSPVRKAFLHRAPQVPANGSLGSGLHVMLWSQCQTPTTAHFLEGKYIQRAWMFLFLISLVEKEERSSFFGNRALI